MPIEADLEAFIQFWPGGGSRRAWADCNIYIVKLNIHVPLTLMQRATRAPGSEGRREARRNTDVADNDVSLDFEPLHCTVGSSHGQGQPAFSKRVRGPDP